MKISDLENGINALNFIIDITSNACNGNETNLIERCIDPVIDFRLLLVKELRRLEENKIRRLAIKMANKRTNNHL